MVIGQGNLGLDLIQAASEAKHEVFVASKQVGFIWPTSLDALVACRPDIVFVTVGHGSITECNETFSLAMSVHVGLPIECMQRFPTTTKIILFSTDYVACEDHLNSPSCQIKKPLSLYALSKYQMEQAMMMFGRPNTCAVRVNSLYGSPLIQNTFPGRLIAKYPNPSQILLPINECTPTSTAWLAKNLLKNLDKLTGLSPMIHHMAPAGSVKVSDWARLFMGPKYDIVNGPPDPQRPLKSALGCSLGPVSTWEDLWRKYGGIFKCPK